MKLRLLLLSLMAGLAGCSSTDANSDPNSNVTKFCENWGKAACSSAVVLACSGADKLTDALTQTCIDKQQAFCEGLLPSNGYSSAEAQQCLNAVKDAYSNAVLTAKEVSTVRHRGDPCNHLIKGPQSKGGSCSSDDDCDTVHDYLCIAKSGEGSCQIPSVVANGTSCEAPEASCNLGFFCDGSNCVQSKASGKACNADFECATGLSCDPDTSKCTARVSQTECTKDDDCTTNVCSIPSGASTGRCVDKIILAPSEGICEDLR